MKTPEIEKPDSSGSRPRQAMRWTINEAALEFGKSWETIARGIRSAGLKAGKDDKFTTLEICAAIYGDLRAERLKKLQLENQVAELEARQKAGDLSTWAEHEQRITTTIVLPLSQWMNTIPTTYDVRCNPDNPQLARETLEQCVEDGKKLIRENLKK